MAEIANCVEFGNNLYHTGHYVLSKYRNNGKCCVK